MATDLHVWQELLAPSSPLVNQSRELRSALIAGSFMGVNVYIYQMGRDDQLSADAQRVLRGLAVYFEHMWFSACRDYLGAETCLELACRESEGDTQELRRLANVVTAIAVGTLTPQNFKEATNFVHSVLVPEQAQAIMQTIQIRRPKLQRLVTSAIHSALQGIRVRSRSG
ncbi:hypothetical protein ACIRG5_45695 [Lentzea sp. NPDC102401]|uniref:hypothetical protein n=1 Tax=Lentzea sp. NPDC102401 TaxID=3364128 RepID=UPI00382BBB08